MKHLLAALGIAAFVSTAKAAEQPPNIVVILADDFGYGSLTCYGGKGLQTPNMDRLAREGRRFTNAYATGSVCSPTRYALMTGRYFWRTSVKDGEVLSGNAPLHIETDRPTFASVAKGKGYRTAAFGKWHLGMGSDQRTNWDKPLIPGPLEVGFDHFFGMGSNPWSGPHTFINDHEVTGRVPGESIVISGQREGATTSGIKQMWDEHHITETLTAKATEWLKQESDKPFLLYFAQTAVHRPIAPNPNFTGSPYGAYGDYIHELDWSVGEVLKTLDETGHADDTLVIFTSDNGGVANEGLNDEIGAARKAGLTINGELRGGKHDIWEGGFRVPFIVRWPGHVPAGTTSDAIVAAADVTPTIAGLLGVPLGPGQAEDGFDARPAFFDVEPAGPVRDAVVLQDAHATYAIREGDWKLVERTTTPEVEPRNRAAARRQAQEKAQPKRDELFNLAEDLGETKDVSGEHPEIVERLRQRLIQSRDRGYTRPGAGERAG